MLYGPKWVCRPIMFSVPRGSCPTAFSSSPENLLKKNVHPPRRPRASENPHPKSQHGKSATRLRPTPPHPSLHSIPSPPRTSNHLPVLSPPLCSSSSARREDGEAVDPAGGEPGRHEPGELARPRPPPPALARVSFAPVSGCSR